MSWRQLRDENVKSFSLPSIAIAIEIAVNVQLAIIIYNYFVAITTNLVICSQRNDKKFNKERKNYAFISSTSEIFLRLIIVYRNV